MDKVGLTQQHCFLIKSFYLIYLSVACSPVGIVPDFLKEAYVPTTITGFFLLRGHSSKLSSLFKWCINFSSGGLFSPPESLPKPLTGDRTLQMVITIFPVTVATICSVAVRQIGRIPLVANNDLLLRTAAIVLLPLPPINYAS